jgi:hypothetical protein
MRRHVKYRQFHVCDAQLQSILLYPGYLWGVEGGVWRSCVEYRHPSYPGDRTPSWEFSWIPSPCSYTIHFCIHPPTLQSPPRTSTLGEKEQSSMYFRNDGKGIFSDMYRILLAALQYRHSDVFCDSSDSVIHGMQDSLSSNFLRR